MGISERTLAALREDRDRYRNWASELRAKEPQSELASEYVNTAKGILVAMRTIERVELVECMEAVKAVEAVRNVEI